MRKYLVITAEVSITLVLVNIFTSDLEKDVSSTLAKSADYTKLEGFANLSKGKAIIE